MQLWLVAAVVVLSLPAFVIQAEPWPGWRGARQDGTTPETAFPMSWSPTNNVRWKVPLPDRGNSTPVVWGGRVFITQSTERPAQRAVMAYDRLTGERLWVTSVLWDLPETTHEDNPYCAASPVTDGELVIAYFGSAGVYAIAMDGAIAWRREFAPQKHEWGYASSPVLFGDRVYVYHGPGPGAKLMALNKRSGSVAWQVSLPEPVPTERTDGFKGRSPGMVGSFSTPLVIEGEKPQVVMSLPESLRSFDAATGAERWRAGGLNPLVYSSPTRVGDLVVGMGGFFGSTVAVRPDGSGDVTATHVAWREERSRKNRIGSPVYRDGHVYVVNQEGFLECLEQATGKQLWEERLNGPGAKDGTWASPALVGDKIYAFNASGDGFIIRASPKFEVLATNTVAEPMNASPALSDGEIFVRTWKSLWCISEKSVSNPASTK